MTSDHAQAVSESSRQRQTLWLALLIAACFACVVGLSMQLENWRRAHPAFFEINEDEEPLYGTSEAARRMSLGFNGLVADWYWMRSLQYVGRKIINYQEGQGATPGGIRLDDLSALNLKQLYPLLDRATTLDPQFIAVYEYGGVILPALDDTKAIALLEKGIRENPQEWRLYQHLGYIYWKRPDYRMASAVYGKGAQIPGAPPWMQAMSARLLAEEGGGRETAREMYRRMMEETTDQEIRRMAELRLAQIDSFDERDAIRPVLKRFRERTGRCAASWREVAQELAAARLPNGGRLKLDASGAPLDPADTAYVLIADGCDVDLDHRSIVPYK